MRPTFLFYFSSLGESAATQWARVSFSILGAMFGGYVLVIFKNYLTT
jgi:hypothetical protein